MKSGSEQYNIFESRVTFMTRLFQPNVPFNTPYLVKGIISYNRKWLVLNQSYKAMPIVIVSFSVALVVNKFTKRRFHFWECQ